MRWTSLVTGIGVSVALLSLTSCGSPTVVVPSASPAMTAPGHGPGPGATTPGEATTQRPTVTTGVVGQDDIHDLGSVPKPPSLTDSSGAQARMVYVDWPDMQLNPDGQARLDWPVLTLDDGTVRVSGKARPIRATVRWSDEVDSTGVPSAPRQHVADCVGVPRHEAAVSVNGCGFSMSGAREGHPFLRLGSSISARKGTYVVAQLEWLLLDSRRSGDAVTYQATASYIFRVE